MNIFALLVLCALNITTGIVIGYLLADELCKKRMKNK